MICQLNTPNKFSNSNRLSPTSAVTGDFHSIYVDLRELKYLAISWLTQVFQAQIFPCLLLREDFNRRRTLCKGVPGSLKIKINQSILRMGLIKVHSRSKFQVETCLYSRTDRRTDKRNAGEKRGLIHAWLINLLHQSQNAIWKMQTWWNGRQPKAG